MNCPACQTPYNPGNRFCGRCGADLSPAPDSPPANPPTAAPAANPPAADPPPTGIPANPPLEFPAPPADPPSGLPVNPPPDFPAPATPFHPYAAPSDAGPAGGASHPFAAARPGGFWIRVPAYLIDALIISLPLVLLWMLFGLPVPTTTDELLNPPDAFRRLQLFNIFLAMAYDTALIALYAATVGKRLFGLSVVRTDGSRVGWGRAFSRHLLTALTFSFTFGLAFLIVALRPDKRGLHDLLCDTIVLRRPRQPK